MKLINSVVASFVYLIYLIELIHAQIPKSTINWELLQPPDGKKFLARNGIKLFYLLI